MDTKKIILTQGIKIFVLIGAFFLIMKVFNLEHITELRLINFLFVFWGVNGAIKKNIKTNINTNYLTNLSIGYLTASVAVILTAASSMVYLFYIDPAFLMQTHSMNLWGANLTPPLISFAILIEGLASSMICSFVLMQYWKNFKVRSPQSVAV